MSNLNEITLEDLKTWKACNYPARVAYFAGRTSLTCQEVATDSKLSQSNRLWVLTRVLFRKSSQSLVGFVQQCAMDARVAADRAATQATDTTYHSIAFYTRRIAQIIKASAAAADDATRAADFADIASDPYYVTAVAAEAAIRSVDYAARAADYYADYGSVYTSYFDTAITDLLRRIEE